MDPESNMQIKRLGEPAVDVDHPRERRGFAGDCVHAIQRHSVDCMQPGVECQSTGHDYLKTVRVVDAVYDSAEKHEVVKL